MTQSQREIYTHGACMLSSFGRVWLFATMWSAACQAPLSMGFTRQKHWSGLLCPPLGIFPTQGSTQRLLHLLHCRWILYHWATWKEKLSLYICMDMDRYINRKKERKRNRGRRKKITSRKNIAQGTCRKITRLPKNASKIVPLDIL